MFRFRSRQPQFVVETLEEDDAAAIADIHRDSFSRGWSREEFVDLMVQRGVFGFAMRRLGNRRAGPGGFVLARSAADEAEILTIAVSPAFRRAGLGRELMDAVLRELHAQRVLSLFLEVDESNLAGKALYGRLGFREVGRRPGYYAGSVAPPATALVMRRDLARPQKGNAERSAT